jgi:hypothetical protein
MKEYFTKSSNLIRRQKKMLGGKHGGIGTQGFDSNFPDSIPTTIATKGIPLCYKGLNESNGPPYHPQWGKEFCHQKGGRYGASGVQGFDVEFPDILPTTIATKGVPFCYKGLNESNGPPYHPQWGKEFCHQKGGKKVRYSNYKAYKKYKMKYKKLKKYY